MCMYTYAYFCKIHAYIYIHICKHNFIPNLLASGIGLWVVTAFINHADDPNCEYHAYGDSEIMLIRAKRALKAGTEITVSYIEAATEGQRKSLKMWGIKSA